MGNKVDRNIDWVVDEDTGELVGYRRGHQDDVTLAKLSTDANGNMALAVDGVTIPLSAERPAITREWTKLAGPNTLATFTYSAEIPVHPKVNEIFRREGAAIKIDGATMTQEYGNISASGLAWDLSAGGVVALLVYIHNLSSTLTQLKLYLGTDYNNCRYVNFTNGDGQLQEGWNLLTIHTDEYNNFFQTQNKVNVTGWGARVAGVNQAAPQALGVGHNFATTPVSYFRLEYNNALATQCVAYLEGIYFGGFETPTLTIGYDIQGSNLDVYIKPAMDANGFKGYIACPTANADPANPTYGLTAAELARMRQYHSEGWDIIPHSTSHNSLSTIEDAQRIADEYEACREQLTRLGCWRGSDLFVAPNNASDNRSIYELAQRGCRWQRCSGRVFAVNSLVGQVNPLLEGSLSGGGNTLAYLTNAVDSLIMYGGTAHFFAHEVYGALTGHPDGDGTNYPSATQMYKYTLENFLAYVKQKVDAGLLRVVTPSQMLNKVGVTLPRNILGIPNQRTITPAASPFTYVNRSYNPTRLLVSGGTVSAIDFAMDGITFTSTGQTAGMYLVQPGEAVKITYSVAPTILQQRVSS